MSRTGFALLEFHPKFNLSKKKKLRDGLSVVVQIGNTLWVTNDETISLERLTRQKGGDDALLYGDHTQFALNDYLQLPVAPLPDPEEIQEADVEGLAYDSANGYLWLVGSHSLKREKTDEHESIEENVKRLAKVSSDGNRFLLARIPLAEVNGTYTLEKEIIELDGKKRIAAQLRGDDQGNALTEALTQDKYLQSFLAIPSKDNGFDIEGLAIVGKRLFIGLRGPVLRGWAVILEVEPQEDDTNPSLLKLKNIGSGDRPYQMHFLQLGGLGIRDLCVQDFDLLILAGPTMDLDGPVTVLRWPRGTQPQGESLVFDKNLTTVLNVPYGQVNSRGTDHAEGMTLFATEDGNAHALLIVYDSAFGGRKWGNNGVEADLFQL
jgi:hypothetical protein